ncbi:hypothetical protein HMPREF1580_00186 [Gardnerella vaginalis JCP8070]|nr:hypothetical protein HMPREF1580_00186 [Gardnerella vaginalis JCP8070]RIY21429.1 hypothetical protein CJI53_04735 [Bifidobacteriaceae bacterium VN002]
MSKRYRIESLFHATDLCNASYRSRGLRALTSSPRRSSASALSGSANRSAFARYALSAHASRFALRFK